MSQHDLTLLRAMPEPAVLVREQTVVGCNAPAQELFEGISPGSPVPECLICEAPAAAMVQAGGRCWHMDCVPVGEETLCLLHAARMQGVSRSQLDGVMRQLREHLAQLMLNVQLLGREQSGQEAYRAERLGALNRALCRMLRLTDQLDLLRDIEADALPFFPMTLDLAGLCREVTAGAQSLLELAGKKLHFDSPLTSLLVSGDSELLQKLLLELISNAARAAAPGSTLKLTLSRRDGRAMLTLSGDGDRDDGRPLGQLLAGDPPADRLPLPGEGAGLGLSVAQHIVFLHEGTLMMERREGVNVTVALPLAPSGAPLSVRAPEKKYGGGLSAELVELADLLPDAAFSALEDE